MDMHREGTKGEGRLATGTETRNGEDVREGSIIGIGGEWNSKWCIYMDSEKTSASCFFSNPLFVCM
jgi:hypothetical protein